MDTKQFDILLVDDDSDDAELIIRTIESDIHGFKVRWIQDGVEALSYLSASASAQGVPRVVLLDIKMPKLSGIEILARLKRSKQAIGLPIVMLSSSNQESDINACYELGANSYLVKPVDYTRFKETILLACLYWVRHNRTGPEKTLTA